MPHKQADKQKFFTKTRILIIKIKAEIYHKNTKKKHKTFNVIVNNSCVTHFHFKINN